MSTTLDYLLTLKPDEMKAVAATLSATEVKLVVSDALSRLQNLSAHLVQNKDEIWHSKEIDFNFGPNLPEVKQ